MVKEKYDICIIDTRPAIEQITTSALAAADVLLTPVCLDKFCRDNLLLVEEKYHDHFGRLSGDPVGKSLQIKVENKRTQRNTYLDMVEKTLLGYYGNLH